MEPNLTSPIILNPVLNVTLNASLYQPIPKGITIEIEQFALILSFIALLISVLIGYHEINTSKKANALPVLIDLVREFRSMEFKKARQYVINDLEKECNPKDGYWDLKEQSRINVLKVSNFFDNVGILVAFKIADEDIIISYWGNSILTVWTKLYPYLKNERLNRLKRNQHGEYQEYFEDLVCRINNRPVSYILKEKLKLQKIEELEQIPTYNDPTDETKQIKKNIRK